MVYGVCVCVRVCVYIEVREQLCSMLCTPGYLPHKPPGILLSLPHPSLSSLLRKHWRSSFILSRHSLQRVCTFKPRTTRSL